MTFQKRYGLSLEVNTEQNAAEWVGIDCLLP